MTLTQRVRFRFDNALLRGSLPLLTWLVLVTLGVIVVAAAVIWLTGWGPDDEGADLPESVWLALTRSLDPGTFGGDQGGRFRLVMLVVTLAGLLIVATVIGLVTTGIDRRLEELRKGHSFVPEQGHQLILGWSSLVPRIVAELAEANQVTEDSDNPAIVVMTTRKAADVEHDIRSTLSSLQAPSNTRRGRPHRRRQRDVLGRARLVVRNGDPASRKDLELVRPAHARSIIVASPSNAHPDAQVVRVAMALQNFPEPVNRSRPRPVVLEMTDKVIAQSLGDGLRQSNFADSPIIEIPQEVVGRITAKVLRSRGLSSIYEDLLDFGKQEFYVRKPADCQRRGVFGDVVLSWEDACVVGVIDAARCARLALPLTYPMESVQSLIVLAADDDDKLFPDPKSDPVGPPRAQDQLAWVKPNDDGPVRVLVVGWSAMGLTVVDQLEKDLGPRLETTVAVDTHHLSPRTLELLRTSPRRFQLREGDTADAHFIQRLVSTGTGFDHVLLLCYREAIGEEEAEAHALLTLLHVKNALRHSDRTTNVVAELLQAQDEQVAEGLAGADDFIVSDRLMALLLSQGQRSPRARRHLR